MFDLFSFSIFQILKFYVFTILTVEQMAEKPNS